LAGTGLKHRDLRPHTIDAAARGHAKRLADQWRAAGLEVDLVEYLGTNAEAGGYTVTARSPSSVLSCRCQSWQARTWLLGRRPVWTVAVSMRGGPQGAAGPLQEVGVAAAWEHQVVWDAVQKWIDGAGTLAPTLDEALAGLP
jgi:hypothetical protein